MRRFPDPRHEAGQSAAEYSVVLAVITPAIVLTIALLADTVAGLFQKVVDVLS
jgi:Flp pilus assembly pilin Flp